MQIDTNPKNPELPEDHRFVEALDDQEQALYSSVMEESADVAINLLIYESRNAGFGSAESEVIRLQRKYDDVLLLRSLLRELAMLRIQADRANSDGRENE